MTPIQYRFLALEMLVYIMFKFNIEWRSQVLAFTIIIKPPFNRKLKLLLLCNIKLRRFNTKRKLKTGK